VDVQESQNCCSCVFPVMNKISLSMRGGVVSFVDRWQYLYYFVPSFSISTE